jgi:hypothetical protein
LLKRIMRIMRQQGMDAPHTIHKILAQASRVS